MKNQALFSSKDKSKKLECRLLQISFGAVRVKSINVYTYQVKYAVSKICVCCLFHFFFDGKKED